MNKCNKNSKYISELNKENYAELSRAKYLKDKQLSVGKVKNGLVVPPVNPKLGGSSNPSKTLFGSGGVFDGNNKYLRISAQPASNMRNRIGEPSASSIDHKIVHEKVIYMNYFIKQWGHFLIDVVGRLWYTLKNHDLKIVYTCYQGESTEITGNYLQFLELLGIDKQRLILVNHPTKFDEVIIPESSILAGEYYTKEYKEIFDTVVRNTKIKPIVKGKKIYCSRANLKKTKRNEFGEEVIENNLKANGFSPVHMEQMTLKEQIKVLNEAEFITMISGSLAHNLLFVRNENTSFVFNKTYRINLHQFLVNDISSSNCFFVDSYVSPLPVLYGYGPFIMRTTSEFKNFANDFKIKITYPQERVSSLVKLKYYIMYLILYRKFLLKRKKIQESNNKRYEPDYRTIRKYYKEYEQKI